MINRRLISSAILIAVWMITLLTVPVLSSGPTALEQVEEPLVVHPSPATRSPWGQGKLSAAEVEPFVLTLTAHNDAWVEQANPSANHGTDLELDLSPGSGGQNQALILLDFDLSGLPADAVVISATLSAYSADTASDPFPITPYANTEAWNEETVNWYGRPNASHLGDPAAEHVPEGWTVFEVTHIVQAWQDGSLISNGITLKATTPAAGTRTYQARDTATPPELAIYYVRQVELTAVADSRVEQTHPSTNYGNDPSLRAAGGDAMWSLVAFDLASLPAEFSVSQATLSMYSTPNLGLQVANQPQADDLYANAVTEDWDEMTVTWNDRPASYYLSDPPTTFEAAGLTYWEVTNIVQSWGDGSLPNYGIKVWSDPSGLGGGWWSRETSEPPKLAIEYGAPPPTCNPITSIDVNGATAGLTGMDYDFDVTYFPVDADPPDNVSWQVTGYPDRLYGESVTLNWATAGVKTLTVVASHCGGSSSTVHTIDISDPPPDCTTPLTRVGLSGPVVIAAGQPYTYHAASVPYNATDPVTFTWEATGQATHTYSVTTNYSDQPYQWDTVGSKRITVTAENCGGTVATYYGVEVVDPADLPDLVISTAWNEVEHERVGYIVHNLGNTTAPAGFDTGLKQGPNTVAYNAHADPVGPGGVGLGYVDFAWTCGTSTEAVGVMADWADEIAEADENNNEWAETWACDQTPPQILTGPDVLDVTETQARVTWTTDEACQSRVEYGQSPYNQPQSKAGSGAYITTHSINLTGLAAGTTYYAMAFCTDEAGLTVNSAPVQFETNPPGSDPPVIRSLSVQKYNSTFYEFWEVRVEIEDDAYMDRVTCSMDGTPLGIDYSADTSGTWPRYSLYVSPAGLGLTRADFFGTRHFECTAYRQYPTAFSTAEQDVPISGDLDYPLRMWINEPYNGQKMYIAGSVVPAGTTLDVSLDAAAHEWGCTASAFSEGDEVPPGHEAVDCDDLAPIPLDSLELWIDGVLQDTITPPPDTLVNTLTGDIGGLAEGGHEIKTIGYKGSSQIEKSRTLVVEQGEPALQIERSIRREGNTLEITLDLHNAGTIAVDVNEIRDSIRNLQQINRTDASGDYTVGTDYGEWPGQVQSQRRNYVAIEFPTALTLDPGEGYSVSYVVVPIIHVIKCPGYIGDEYITVFMNRTPQSQEIETYRLPGEIVNDPSYGLLPLQDAIDNAVRQADYVIVTTPKKVYSVLAGGASSHPDAEELFANMAELAALENGVLGYLFEHGYTGELDDLIEPDGRWANALNPVFNETDKGYVLIVGETEIVEADYVGTSHFWTYAGIPDKVYDSDLWYANTRGETARPELVVGRVIGNGLNELNIYLERAIRAAQGEAGIAFARDKAYVCNGNGDGEWTFQDDAEQVDDQLDAHFTQSTWINFMNDGSEAQKAYHLQYLPDRNLVLYRGHGNQDAWDDGLLASDVNAGVYNFGSTSPAMLAAACVTGNYENHNDLNLAEVLLREGASIYVGATGISERWANSDAFTHFFSNWQLDESMGQAINQLKRQIWNWDGVFDHRKLWAFQYNLYGDPKYGRIQTQAAALSQPEDESLTVTMTPHGTSLGVALPELEFSQVEGHDLARIPGGGTLAELGAYPVPVWTVSVDLPAGQRVQDVQLVSRSSPVVTGNLSLPLVTAASDCGCAGSAGAAPTQPTATDWYPDMEQVLDWSVEEQANGKTTLYVVLYPFYYNAQTGDALYYRKHTLSITTLKTSVAIDLFKVNQSEYEPGDPVTLSLVIDNPDFMQDIVLQPSVRTWGTNQVLGGLPLQTLHEMSGTATVDLTWDTGLYAAGDYQLVVELLDSRGLILDTAVADVKLGKLDVRLTGLTASQETFAPGDVIELSLGVINTGTLPITGTAVFMVQDSESLSVTQFITVPIVDLAPGTSAEKIASWDTTDVTGQRYRVVGYLKFYSMSTEPLALTLYRPRIFLPVVMHNH